MKIKKFRDLMIGIAAIIFSISLIIFIYEQIKFFPSEFLTESDIMVFSSCEKFKDYYIATVEIENTGAKDIKDIKCRILDKGDLSVDKEEQTISELSVDSSDVFTFILKGDLIKPVKFEINFDGKSKKDVCDLIEG